MNLSGRGRQDAGARRRAGTPFWCAGWGVLGQPPGGWWGGAAAAGWRRRARRGRVPSGGGYPAGRSESRKSRLIGSKFAFTASNEHFDSPEYSPGPAGANLRSSLSLVMIITMILSIYFFFNLGCRPCFPLRRGHSFNNAHPTVGVGGGRWVGWGAPRPR